MGIQAPLGFQQVTVLTAATALTVIAPANYALIECDATANKAVRWRDDTASTAVSATVGMRLAPGAQLEYDGDLNALRFIEEAASAKINVTYYLKAR